MTRSESTSGPGAAAPKRIRIVLADDHRVVRRGLELVLNAEPEFEVVAEVGDVAAVRIALREHEPDVLVLDLNMPGEPSLPAIEELRAMAPRTQIVVLTMEHQLANVREARRAGALGYVLKEAADSELAEAVRRAAAGVAYLNRRLAGALVADTTHERDWG